MLTIALVARRRGARNGEGGGVFSPRRICGRRISVVVDERRRLGREKIVVAVASPVAQATDGTAVNARSRDGLELVDERG